MSELSQSTLLAVPLAPLAGAVIAGFFGKTIGRRASHVVTILGVLIAFVLFEPMGLYGRWLKIRTYLQMFPFYRKGMFKRQKSFQKSDRLK